MKEEADHVLDFPADYRGEEELSQLSGSDDVAKLRSILQDDERVYRLVLCLNNGSDAVLAATNKRIIYCDKKFMSTDVVSLKYREVAAVISNAELVTTKISLAYQDGSLSVEGVDKQHGARFIDYLEGKIGKDFKLRGKGPHSFEHIGHNILDETPDEVS